MTQAILFTKVIYNINKSHSYTKRTLNMSISGSHAGQTESAVMNKLKQRHGRNSDITILSIDWR